MLLLSKYVEANKAGVTAAVFALDTLWTELDCEALDDFAAGAEAAAAIRMSLLQLQCAVERILPELM